MVNLDDIKNGDTIVVEGIAYVSDDNRTISLTRSVIRNRYWATEGLLKVISHTPQPITEPKGIGAVVKVKGKTGNVYKAVKVGLGTLNWAVHNLSDNFYAWEDVTRAFQVVEVVSEGVEVDTD